VEITGGPSLAAGGISNAGTISGVTAGTLSASSTEAVNGSQLFAVSNLASALGDSLETVTGGGLVINPDGTIATPATINIGGVAYSSVTDAIAAGDAKADMGLSAVASALGGGAVYDPVTGEISAPSYTVGGATYTNFGDSFTAIGDQLTDLTNGTTGFVLQTGGAPGNGQITIGAATGGTSLSVAGIDSDRVVTGVAIGSLSIGSNDAVNGSQIYALAASTASNLGGGSAFDPSTGVLTAPTYSVAGGTQTNVGAALDALDNKATAAGTTILDALGGGASVAPDGTITAPSFAVGGNTYTTVGGALTALANGAAGPIQYANAGTPRVANGGTPTQYLTLVGAAAGPVTLDNVGPGLIAAGSTQAINGSQLNTALGSIASGLGGGSVYDPATGTVTSPVYNIGGNTYNNLGSAIGGLNTVVAGLASGSTGLIQQPTGPAGSGPISIGGTIGGTSISVAGTDGDRVVSGVANGAVTASSTDAVNGSQLFDVKQTADGALQRSGGTLTGSINAGGNSITNLAAPVNGGDATNKAYVDGVAASASATTTNVGQAAASHFGGGSAYNAATGQVSAPKYTVGGKDYSNVGAAFTATNMLAVQYVTDAGGAPTNAVRLGTSAGSPPVALRNVAAGTVSATSTDAVNGGQLFAVQQTADGALQKTGGTLSGNLALDGNRITGLGAAVDSGDAVSKGYVDALLSTNANRFDLQTARLNEAFEGIERNSQGVALAIAMGGGFLSDDKDFSLWGAWGNFNGYNAAALQTYLRLSDDTYINAGFSVGFEESLIGTRVGFGIQF
jgi:trimeric autotransporter adhesin